MGLSKNKTKESNTLESDTLRACQDWLEMMGILYVRHNLISFFGDNRGGGQWRRTRDSQKGGPDLIVCPLGGKPVFVECKGEKGNLSLLQERWRRRAEEAGYQYVVVREISDLWEILK